MTTGEGGGGNWFEELQFSASSQIMTKRLCKFTLLVFHDPTTHSRLVNGAALSKCDERYVLSG